MQKVEVRIDLQEAFDSLCDAEQESFILDNIYVVGIDKIIEYLRTRIR